MGPITFKPARLTMVIIHSHSLHRIFRIPALVTRSLIKHQPIHPASTIGIPESIVLCHHPIRISRIYLPWLGFFFSCPRIMNHIPNSTPNRNSDPNSFTPDLPPNLPPPIGRIYREKAVRKDHHRFESNLANEINKFQPCRLTVCALWSSRLESVLSKYHPYAHHLPVIKWTGETESGTAARHCARFCRHNFNLIQPTTMTMTMAVAFGVMLLNLAYTLLPRASC